MLKEGGPVKPISQGFSLSHRASPLMPLLLSFGGQAHPVATEVPGKPGLETCYHQMIGPQATIFGLANGPQPTLSSVTPLSATIWA